MTKMGRPADFAMTSRENRSFTAFLGHEIIAKGDVEAVVHAAKEHIDAGAAQRLAIFDDAEARVHDFDFRGTMEEVLARLDSHPLLPERNPAEKGKKATGTGPGRPRLGVVSKEVTLLPRHWAWLGSQRGGASATLRRLVEEAAKREAPGEGARKVQEATYRFMWDMAGDLPDFEEASRAFFGKDYDTFSERIEGWPPDIRNHVLAMLDRQIRLEGD